MTNKNKDDSTEYKIDDTSIQKPEVVQRNPSPQDKNKIEQMVKHIKELIKKSEENK